MFRTLQESSRDREAAAGLAASAAALVVHVTRRWRWFGLPNAARGAGPDHESAVCGCAGLGVGGARQRVPTPFVAAWLRRQRSYLS